MGFRLLLQQAGRTPKACFKNQNRAVSSRDCSRDARSCKVSHLKTTKINKLRLIVGFLSSVKSQMQLINLLKRRRALDSEGQGEKCCEVVNQ
jgi:hypothetical protein